MGEVIYNARDRVSELIVISCGECRAEIEVEPILPPNFTLTASTASLKVKGRQVIDLGRIAPFSVLGLTVVWSENSLEESFAKETVLAATHVHLFAMSKNDFQHLPAETRLALASAVKNFEAPSIPQLWEIGPKAVSDQDWKMGKAWKSFQREVSQRKGVSILDSMK